MNLQSILVVSLILCFLIFGLLKNFFEKRINSGQTLFWLFLLISAEILVVFPSLIDWLSVIWGNILPVSWITLVGISFLILYLFYQTIAINNLQSKIVDLSRQISFFEKKMRDEQIKSTSEIKKNK